MILNMNEIDFDNAPPKYQTFSDKTVTLDITELEFDPTGQINMNERPPEPTETADIIALTEDESEDTIEFVRQEQKVLDIESLLVEPEQTDSLDESAILREEREEVTTEIAGGDILDIILKKPAFSDDSFIRKIDESLVNEFQAIKKNMPNQKIDLITPQEIKMIHRDLNHSCALILHLIKMENPKKARRVLDEVQSHFKGDKGVVELMIYLFEQLPK